MTSSAPDLPLVARIPQELQNGAPAHPSVLRICNIVPAASRPEAPHGGDGN